MNVTFPTLMEEFSVTTATVQWITTGYLLLLPLLLLSLVFGVTSIRQVSEPERMPFPWLEYLLLACAFVCLSLIHISNGLQNGYLSCRKECPPSHRRD